MKVAKSKTRKPGKTSKHPERSQALVELEYREQRYRSIAESTPDGMVTVDAQGKIVLWNRAAEKIFGYTAEEMLGKLLTRIMPKRFQEAHKNSLNRVASGGKPRIIGKTVELIGLRKDKSEFPLELSMAKWKTGEGVFFTAVIRDISERKLTEEALQQSQERYQNLVENINDVIFEVDTDGKITYISPAIERIGKYKADELIGQNFSRFVHLDDMPDLISSFRRVLAGILKPFEFRVLDKDGSIRYARSNSRQQMQHGQVTGITGVLSDVTEHKQAEEESNFRAQLLDSATDSIFVHDFDGNIIYANEVACKSRGYTKEEFMKMNIRELAVPEYAAVIEPKLSDFLEAGKAVFEFAHFRKDKSIMPVEIQSQIIKSGSRKLVLGIARDITERKKMQESLVVTDRLAALGSMAGGFAHELNNPLTGVIGYAQLLLDRKDLSEAVRKDLTGIYEEAQRASEVIKNFMVFALKRPLQMQLSDINSFIKDVLKLRQYEQKNTNIKVKTNFDPELPLVMVGPVRMHQVFLNIIINAEYFMFQAHKKGTLTITTESKGDIIRASFADDGPGITPENLGQIFNPFFTTKEVGQGIGLGLSICHSIVTEHGGNIYVESEPGKGATFIVELPVSKGKQANQKDD